MDKVKGDGSQEFALAVSYDNLNDALNKIEQFYQKSLQDRDDVVREYENTFDNFKKLKKNPIIKSTIGNIHYQEAFARLDMCDKFIKEDNLIDATNHVNAAKIALKSLYVIINREKEIIEKFSSLSFSIDSVRKYIRSNSQRIMYMSSVDNYHSVIRSYFSKDMKSILDYSKMGEIIDLMDKAFLEIKKIEKSYKDEQEEEERRRREREEEEERRRREREEEERRSSYYSNYDSGLNSFGSSSSWDSGSSFDSGSSGGRGASSDW